MASWNFALTTALCLAVVLCSGTAATVEPSLEEPAKLDVRKCCDLGEEFDSTLDCIPRSRGDLSLLSKRGLLLPNETNRRYWVPPELENYTLNATFKDMVRFSLSSCFFIFSEKTDEYSLDQATLTVFRSYGLPIALQPKDYCIDSVRGRNIVFISCLCSRNYECRNKCCSGQQLLTSDEGHFKCIQNYNANYTFLRFDSKQFNTSIVRDHIYSFCRKYSFHPVERRLRSLDDIAALVKAEMSARISTVGFSEVVYCADKMAEDGEDVLAYCSRPLSGWYLVWFLSRPLCFLAALLLGLALVAVALQPKLHISNHGRSLACHAAALFLFNAQQCYFRYGSGLPKAWEWWGEDETFRLCLNVAYPIYYMLQASNFWLCIVCVNMALGFRRMQRRKDGSWKRFAIYSVFGWGGPLILTAATAFMCEHFDWEDGLIIPDLMETRTCFYNIYHSAKHKITSGGMLYYYLPSSILLLINLGLFWYIFFKIHLLKRETAMLRESEAHRPDAFGESAWLYVRLLLTTGIVEAFVEVATWGGSFLNSESESVEHMVFERDFICQYETPLNALDALRAAFVFRSTWGSSRNYTCWNTWGKALSRLRGSKTVLSTSQGPSQRSTLSPSDS